MVFFQPLTLKEKGNYENGKKVGVWLISKENGQVFERFDFDHNKKLTPLIHVYVHYPSSAREQNIEGIVTISFNTDKNCSVSNITIIKGLSKDCDKAALDAIREVAVLMKKYGEDCEEKVETLDLKFAIP
jgi:TonB family protein